VASVANTDDACAGSRAARVRRRLRELIDFEVVNIALGRVDSAVAAPVLGHPRFDLNRKDVRAVYIHDLAPNSVSLSSIALRVLRPHGIATEMFVPGRKEDLGRVRL